jgi:hypothetical protein
MNDLSNRGLEWNSNKAKDNYTIHVPYIFVGLKYEVPVLLSWLIPKYHSLIPEPHPLF